MPMEMCHQKSGIADTRTRACQPPERGDTDRASKPRTEVQKRTDRSMSATVKLM